MSHFVDQMIDPPIGKIIIIVTDFWYILWVHCCLTTKSWILDFGALLLCFEKIEKVYSSQLQLYENKDIYTWTVIYDCVEHV